MIYLVELSRQAEKEMVKIDRILARRLRDRIRELAKDPFDPRLSRQLEMNPERRYSRVSDWRIVFAVNKSAGILEIALIQHRSQIYKKI